MDNPKERPKYEFVDMNTKGDEAVATAFSNQVAYCEHAGAQVTARICAAILAALGNEPSNRLIDKVKGWQGAPLADALPLRVAGGIHALHLSGAEPALAPIYAGENADDVSIVGRALFEHEATLLSWLDGPPQTNEAGRSSNFAAAMLWLAGRGLPPRFECLEIGSSAGINLMMDRYAYDLAGVKTGPDQAAMRFAPVWDGGAPPSLPIEILSTRGCDVAPVDLTDPVQATRLKAYIWPEHTVRFERMEAAIAAASERKPDLVQMNAADFVEAQLALPQVPGTTRVLMHSIVWQYVPENQQRRVTEAMEAAGACATPDMPLAWVSVEADRTVHRHALRVRHWPGGEVVEQLAWSHPHGADIQWIAS